MPFGEDVSAFYDRPLRAEELVYAGVPGLPTREQVAAESSKLQKDKAGLEIAQGEFLGAVLADPVAGTQLVETMLQPIGLDRLHELRATGRVDLGAAVVERRGNVGMLELRNPRHLNAEDDTTLPACRGGGRPHPGRPRDRDLRAARRRRRAPALRGPAASSAPA